MSKLTEQLQPLDRHTKDKRLARLKEYANYARDYGTTKLWYPDGFEGLAPEELAQVGKRLLEAVTVNEAYEVLAQKTIFGRGNYYDRIIGIQHKRAYEQLERVITQEEPATVERALDVAAGTGMSTLALANTAETLVAVDIVPVLLNVARERFTAAGIKRFDIREMNALELSFSDDEKFDIVISNGLTSYLSSDEQTQFMRGVHRSLKPGGRYYRYTHHRDETGGWYEYETSQRAVLAGIVTSALITRTFGGELPDEGEPPKPEELGFSKREIKVTGKPYREVVTQLTKV